MNAKTEYRIPKNLLSIDNAKTVKGEKLGIKTYILYLAPHKQNDLKVNICKFASKGCIIACLFSSGMGKFSNVIEGRVNKTNYYVQNRVGFVAQLIKEIEKTKKRHIKKGNKCAIRLNGTSDLNFSSVINKFPNIQFYDYTPNIRRAIENKLPNYDITFSGKEDNQENVKTAMAHNIKVAIVVNFDTTDLIGKTYKGKTFVNGDDTDVRFLDPKGAIVLLRAKGDAKKDTTGFVYHSFEEIKEKLFN
tara:strand:+ start:400 stop:1140 length:741 start_codon:yes stop_codon:yes gene_type:complete